MPITHGDEAARVEIRREGLFQSAGLAFGKVADGRLAANGIVMFANDTRTAVGDPPREGTPRQPATEEIDDVGIAEKIVEERLDRFGRIGSAELEEDDAEAGFGHAALGLFCGTGTSA